MMNNYSVNKIHTKSVLVLLIFADLIINAENKLRATECYKTQRRTGMPVEIGETSSGSWDAKTKKEVSDKHTYN